MSSPGQGNKALLVRLAVLIALAAAIFAVIKWRGSPLTITEEQVSRMIRQRELIGLTLEEASDKLQHKPINTAQGTVLFDFAHVQGWTAGPVVLDVRNGNVTGAAWKRDIAPGEE